MVVQGDYNRPPAQSVMKLSFYAVVTLTFATATGTPGLVCAQTLPSSPLVVGDGQFVIGGDVAMTLGERDEIGWFNYTDYERNALRLFRVGLAGEWRPATKLAVLAELRSENLDDLRLSAAYVRFRPWERWPVDVQAGRIPPTFGAFGRRVYGSGNLLIGYPLAYQYLTSLRSDSLPATADDLFRMRARGWQSSFPLGSPLPGPGLPLISAFRWDTGIQVRVGGDGLFGIAGAVTTGTLSNPQVRDDNGGKQVVARAQFRPVFGLVLGVSGARGAWLNEEAIRGVLREPGERLTQRAAGLDVEYSRDHWLVRGEVIRSAWSLPRTIGAGGLANLGAAALSLEGRYRLGPRLFVVARADRLGFSRISAALNGSAPTPWDAPVRRIEAGGGWYLQRNLVARVTWQGNWREDGRQRERHFISTQLTYWF